MVYLIPAFHLPIALTKDDSSEGDWESWQSRKIAHGHFVSGSLCRSYIHFLSLGFLICKMGINNSDHGVAVATNPKCFWKVPDTH